jgi:hypothetical protein
VSGIQPARPTVERRTRHAEIPCDLRRRLPALDKPDSISDLAVGNPPGTAAKIHSGSTPLADRVDYPFTFDLVFHLREGSHDREKHRSHRSRRVDISAAEVEHPKSGAAAAELLSEREHVLSGTAEPVQSGDQQRVTVLQGRNCPIELWAGRPRAGDAMVDLHIIPTDPGRQEIGFLSIR